MQRAVLRRGPRYFVGETHIGSEEGGRLQDRLYRVRDEIPYVMRRSPNTSRFHGTDFQPSCQYDLSTGSGCSMGVTQLSLQPHTKITNHHFLKVVNASRAGLLHGCALPYTW